MITRELDFLLKERQVIPEQSSFDRPWDLIFKILNAVTL